jgi:hypothetical protein
MQQIFPDRQSAGPAQLTGLYSAEQSLSGPVHWSSALLSPWWQQICPALQSMS